MDVGLLILRVVLGLILAAHGTQKVFGWFGGGGVTGTAAMTAKLGFRPVSLWAAMVMAGELGGGLLMALGLLNPLGPLGVGGAMAVAAVTVHRAKGFWNGKGGYEFPLSLLAAALALTFTGAGRFSLDAVLGISIPRNLATVLAGLTVVAVAVALATRHQAPAPQPSTAPA
jgi:putative oxidoreductase